MLRHHTLNVVHNGMKKPIDLTYKVAAYEVIDDFNPDCCIDWATQMILNGFNSDSLFILSSLEKPANYFETINYLQDAFKSLELEFKNDLDGIFSYAYYLLNEIAKNNHIKENLDTLRNFCISKDYADEIFDFYLLSWAWHDINAGIDQQEYWPEANQQNIKNIVKLEANKWIKKHYAQHNL